MPLVPGLGQKYQPKIIQNNRMDGSLPEGHRSPVTRPWADNETDGTTRTRRGSPDVKLSQGCQFSCYDVPLHEGIELCAYFYWRRLS
jgi:hypothetical protein